MQKLVVPLVMAACLVGPAYSQQDAPLRATTAQAAGANLTGPITLSKALELAIGANPELAVARAEVSAVEAASLQASLRPNPSLEAVIEGRDKPTQTTIVQVNIPVELGGKRAKRIAAAQLGYQAASLDVLSTRAEVGANVVVAFYDLVIAQERVQLAQAAADLARRFAMAAGRRVLAGKASPVEETRARVAEATAEAEVGKANAAETSARVQLGALWGATTPTFGKAEHQEDPLTPVDSVDLLLSRLEQSPRMNRLRLEIERRQAMAEVELARRFPDLGLIVGTKRDNQLGLRQPVVGVSIPIPLFDRNQGAVLEALRRTDKAKDELVAATVRARADLIQAHGRLEAATAEARLTRDRVLPGAQSAYDATAKGFELGKFSFLEMLDAQRSLFDARSQYLRALAELHRARADVARIIGLPSPHTGEQNLSQVQP